jgi:hypothetical protein
MNAVWLIRLALKRATGTAHAPQHARWIRLRATPDVNIAEWSTAVNAGGSGDEWELPMASLELQL